MSTFAAPGTYLQELVLATATTDQKIACLKTLRIVVKNLADPVKSTDPKFRQLKYEKVKAKISPCPAAIDYMKAIGFSQITDTDGEEYLRIDAAKTIDISHMQSSIVELNNALEMITPKNINPVFREEKKTAENINPVFREEKKTADTATTTSSTTTGKLSEKQKARLLMEEKERKERAEAKAARKKTSALIKQDKYVRENDENWESKQSAACVKSGTGISTFRDKYGEN
ncbi:hypothetical protein ACHAWC_007642 [Mediolabrus comicus]